ncbi:MAG: leucyl/phenylalanyl-tRNA--protein transferase [Clostridiales bacterium]
MPIFRLTEELVFPHPSLAEDEGVLAVGGDLSVDRLLLAYKNGIFPWYSDNQPIIWWSPDPRFVLFPKKIKISKSMKKVIRKNIFKITYDNCFSEVINKCMELRIDSTWITDEMLIAYINLHKMGFAHSVEVWKNNKLVGGLYGVSIGKCFFGESMFSTESNSSKYALIHMAKKLDERDFLIIDCQQETEHLRTLGSESIPREAFLNIIKEGTNASSFASNWRIMND